MGLDHQGMFFICKDGDIKCSFSHRRLREKPPSGGVSVLSESIEIDKTLYSHAETLLKIYNWNGVAMFEYKITDEGIPYLMEINGRFWGSLQLAIDSGIDFPYLLFLVFSKNQDHINCEYKTKIKLRWLLGDIDNLLITLKDKKNSLKFKLNSIFSFLKLFDKNQFYEINRFNDMRPFIVEIRQYMVSLFH